MIHMEGDFASAGRRAAVPGSDPAARIVASSRADDPVPPTVVETPPGGVVSSVTAAAPTIGSAAPQGRNSEEGRSAIMQARVVLAAARRELDSARAILDVLGGSIADCISELAVMATIATHS